ncbi:MAG: PilC/PilY family type IV pilus protein, partial [Smithella sp.]
KYNINDDGTTGSELWDAGTILMNTDSSYRNIKTLIAGSMTDFSTAIDHAYLGVTTDALRSLIVGFFRGESAYNIEYWKLGDIFRSKPITVGTPSFFFEDMRDTNNAFASFRTSHVRASSPYSGRVVLVGANDGQLHAFKTSDGSEAWSFIPPNLLSRLKMIAHNTHPTSLTHQSYVDGPVTVADAWVPSSTSSGTSKSSSDWQTILLFGEGQGAGDNLWSSSTYCDSGFSQIYTTSYPYYCGYYALNVTSTLAPSFKWRLGVSASAAPYLGAPWSSPMIGRIKDGGNEKWVAFIGGGYSSPGAANSGKGLFVFNMTDGSLLWSYTKADNSSMNDPMPAPPAIVDTDSDGFIDMAYLGDMGSNMWRFKFCKAIDGDSCGTSNWTAGMFYDASASNIRPIFTSATVAKDGYNNVWVYWGTGDKLDPTAPNAQEKLFALKDTDFTSTRNLNDMENITSEGSTYSGTGYGWYINLTGTGEKMLAEPTVFGGVVYFTTYTPPSGNNPCAQGGTASLYGVNYITGAGAIDNGGDEDVRSITIGTGIPSAPVVSMRPGNDPTPDLYVTTSGGGGISGETARINFDPRSMSNRTNIIFWKDTRIE